MCVLLENHKLMEKLVNIDQVHINNSFGICMSLTMISCIYLMMALLSNYIL